MLVIIQSSSEEVPYTNLSNMRLFVIMTLFIAVSANEDGKKDGHFPNIFSMMADFVGHPSKIIHPPSNKHPAEVKKSPKV